MNILNKKVRTFFLGCEKDSWINQEIIPLLEREKGELVKSSNFTTVLKFYNPYNSDVFYFKEYHIRGLKDIIRNIFGYTRGKRELKGINILTKNGFNAPEPVIYGYVKLFGVIYRNFIVTRGIIGERTYQYFKNNFHLPLNHMDIVDKRALITKAGFEIGLLHAKGIFHGDLRVGNILISGIGFNSSLSFIDNERTKKYKRIPMSKRMKNLVQLNMFTLPHLTKTDRLRFFIKYLEKNVELKNRKKEIIKNIQLVTRKRLGFHYDDKQKI